MSLSYEELLALACTMRSDATAKPEKGSGDEYAEDDDPEGPDGDARTSGEVHQTPGEPPKDHREASEKAWTMSGAFEHGKLADAHKDAAKAHLEAAKMSEGAGDSPRAEAHRSMADEHKEAAEKVKKHFGDSSMY